MGSKIEAVSWSFDMTLYRPNLQLRRLKVMAGAVTAYSADFHEGVNIISGQNASGKSTIMDFIFYSLGGESIPWKHEALLCTDVLSEIEINATPVTLRRSVNEIRRNPIQIFWGKLDDAEAASYAQWETYPYQRSMSKESFSQILFRALGLPELRGESAANITMHQILRLMYVDQRTPHDEIFRAEPFDTQLTRETVGNYLCGVYSDGLYDAKLELKSVESELEKAISDLRNIFSILGKSGQNGANTTELLIAEEAGVQREIHELSAKLATAKSARRIAPQDQEATATRIAAIRSELTELQRQFALKGQQLTELELEDKDSAQFISELERRIVALDDSESTRNYFGKVNFKFCPCCFSKVEEIAGNSACTLCKSAGNGEGVASQVLRMRNELALQKAESMKLQASRAERIATLRQEIPQIRRLLGQGEERFYASMEEWNAPQEQEIEDLSTQIGALRQQLLQLGEHQRLAAVIEALQEKRAALQSQRSELTDRILALENADNEAQDAANNAIHSRLIALLRNDLPRQEEFISASAVAWSFGENRVAINGQRQFSESSMVILKHCFHLSLLAASSDLPFFRLPRFMMLDGIDDGGQELERSHALQNSVVELSESLTSSHQIIFATSQIADNLASSSLVVGNASTGKQKTLVLH